MADLSKLRFNGTDYNVKDASAPKRKFDNTYAKTGNLPITSDDTPQTAIGKLEKAHDENQANVLYAINTGVKNYIVCNEKTDVYYGITITRTQDGIQISGTATASFTLSITGLELAEETQDSREYSVSSKLPDSVILTGAPDSAEQNRIIVALYNDQTWIYSFSSLYNMPQDLSNYNYNRWYAYIPIVQNKTYSGIWKPMLRDASISDDTFIPGALPNYDLTRLEAEDRVALAEVVDSGAKNIADIYNVTQNAITIATSGYKATFSGSASQDGSIYWGRFHADKTGDYVLYYDMSNSVGRFTVYNETDSEIIKSCYPSDKLTPISIKLTAGKRYSIYSWFAAGTASACVIDLMITTKAAFNVSQKFVPYQTMPKVIHHNTTKFTASTTMTYTGVSYTIPANTVIRITASALKLHGDPDEIAIASYSNQNIYLAYNKNFVQNKSIASIGTSWIYTTGASTYTIAILAKFVAETENAIELLVEKLN